MEIFKNITSIMYLDFMESEVKTVIEDSLKFQKNYDNCTYKYATLGQLSFDFCVIKNLPEIREIELFEINAFNGHPEIQILNPITALMLPNIPLALKYGYVGATTIGHEMGHTIIPLGLEDGFFPYFSKDVQNCIQNQFNSTCRSFKEESCDVRDDQFDENGADIFGFPFAFDRLKQHLGNRIYEKLPGSRRGLTHAQAYFYAVSNGFCSREDSYSSSDTHGAANARINAGVIQSPEFEKVFNCSKNSRMVQSRKQFCYVLGENAPQN
ncbi:unnamed protein product [Caenorhabditis angaria]|uniref:Peptidase M13 C-terminal domain-containing protein n=1 Tax=Caenorhabditis angaria TaxID=860376 RepID=A0A9P1MZ65_9PELO|nr:unnamed protein product [Caenorhabditis angaria]